MRNKLSVSDALFPKVRQHVLGLLYGHPDLDFHTNEIIRITRSGTGSVQRELANLNAAGLIVHRQVGNQKRYQANQNAPFFVELRSIVLKTFGLADVLRNALQSIKNKIQIAFIYGSVAKQQDTTESDIDLMIIGKALTYSSIFAVSEKAEAQLGRKINPTFYTASDWKRKNTTTNHFIKNILVQPKIFLIGTEHELIELGEFSQNK